MRYIEFRDAIEGLLPRPPGGLTWSETRDRLDLPYDRACPTWTRKLEGEIGLTRRKGVRRALVWRVPTSKGARRM
jgi:hypothetical protein